jgi:ubiquinone biosynthesis protein UbiJ
LSGAASPQEATPAVAFCFFLNRLLEREAWARGKLAPFAGKSVDLRLPLLPPLRVTILEDGRVRAGGEEPSADAKLAAEVALLVRHLRWEAEEDLSRLVGDVAARRIAGAAGTFLSWQADAARRLGEALAAYATDEKQLLVRRAELEALAAQLAGLGEALARLEKREGGLG